MSELRWNPLLGEWVITATQRQDRTFFPPPGYCPLCPTQPGAFETEIPFPDYDIAVFENKFPSFKPQPDIPAVAAAPLTPVAPNAGVCEVVVYSAKHDGTLADESIEQIEKLIYVWRERFAELAARPGIDYVLIFENKGQAIGVTLPHPHGQIYAFPFIPPIPAREQKNMRAHWDQAGECLLCAQLAVERQDARRVVFENAAFTLVIPFYARYPYEVHLLPRQHAADLRDFSPADIRKLAEALKRLLVGYDQLFGFSFPYMMLLHQQPTDGQPHPYWHFHIEFLPPHRTREKLKYLAGVESGAGSFINDTLAEEKAAELRAAIQRGIEAEARDHE